MLGGNTDEAPRDVRRAWTPFIFAASSPGGSAVLSAPERSDRWYLTHNTYACIYVRLSGYLGTFHLAATARFDKVQRTPSHGGSLSPGGYCKSWRGAAHTAPGGGLIALMLTSR